MDYLLHQNMRVFGGGAPPRNNAYHNAFATLSNTLGPPANRIRVAGFTEIVNYATAGAAAVSLAAVMGLNTSYNVACGRTALAAGPEYISIASALPVLSVGRIFMNASGQGMALAHDISPAQPPTAAWCQTVPQQATPDYRGVVYLVTMLMGTPIAVGFLHNLYTFQDQRALVAGQIPHFVYLMASNPAIDFGGPVYLGGDFNLSPFNRNSRNYGAYTAYSAGLAGVLPPGINPGGTTAAGNLYDYWYASIAPATVPPVGFLTPAPQVWGHTLFHPNMSDHCATLLRTT